jgi:hypothetical protein
LAHATLMTYELLQSLRYYGLLLGSSGVSFRFLRWFPSLWRCFLSATWSRCRWLKRAWRVQWDFRFRPR